MINQTTERLNIIFNELPNCSVFADIGCDHGYMTKLMIDYGKCKRAIISDVSKKCLEKAEKLLYSDIKSNKVISVVGDGFEKITDCDLALIAGMGGEEIIKIILGAKKLPDKLVLQPMKNTDKVRIAVVDKGYKIIKDFTFNTDKIYYDLLVLEKGQDSLTLDEIEFGRTNIITRPKAFIDYVNMQVKKIEQYLLRDGMSLDAKQKLQSQLEKYKKYV